MLAVVDGAAIGEVHIARMTVSVRARNGASNQIKGSDSTNVSVCVASVRDLERGKEMFT